MDIISHGLWGGVAFGRENKKRFWTSFIFGIAPDFFAFAPFFASVFLGLAEFPKFSTEPPVPDGIPQYIHSIYSFTHSLIIFAIFFSISLRTRIVFFRLLFSGHSQVRMLTASHGRIR